MLVTSAIDFSKVLSEKSLKFILSRKNDTIVFKFGLILLPMKAGSIPEKQSCKKYALVDYSTGYG